MKRVVGIYFAPDKINLVESIGRKVIKAISVSPSQENINLESKDVDEQIRVVAFLQKAFRDNKIEAKEAIVGIALKDLIVRFFELPIMPRKEFVNALLFEVKRYLPFKIEELVFDFQTRINREKKRSEVLFVATKKENIDRYLAILKEVGLKVVAVEPAILSASRIFNLHKIIDIKASTAIVELNEEKGLMVIDRGFICFAHELKATLDIKDQEADSEAIVLLKLANDIRLTLDYYRRQSIGRHVDNLFIVSDKDLPSGIAELDKELDVRIKTFKIQDIAGSIYISDLGLAIAFSLSQKDQIPAYFKINLLTSRPVSQIAAARKPMEIKPVTQSQLAGYIVVGLLLIGLAYFAKVPEQNRLKDALNLAISRQPKISDKLNKMGLDELKTTQAKLKGRVLDLNKLFKNRLYLTPRLDILARILPDGMWLRQLTVNSSGVRMEGSVYLSDDTQEINLVNNFVSVLKKEAKFLVNLKSVNFSTERATKDKFKLRNFTIECK